jgi:hypothetical protein
MYTKMVENSTLFVSRIFKWTFISYNKKNETQELRCLSNISQQRIENSAVVPDVIKIFHYFAGR